MRRMVIVLLTTALLAPALARAADYPPYLILRAPIVPKTPHHTEGYYPGRAYGVETNAYSYGWFGAKPGKTYTRSFGTNRIYTQWKVQ